MKMRMNVKMMGTRRRKMKRTKRRIMEAKIRKMRTKIYSGESGNGDEDCEPINSEDPILK